MFNVKIDPRMRQAIDKYAEANFISASAVAKQAFDKFLADKKIDWRKEVVPEKKSK